MQRTRLDDPFPVQEAILQAEALRVPVRHAGGLGWNSLALSSESGASAYYGGVDHNGLCILRMVTLSLPGCASHGVSSLILPVAHRASCAAAAAGPPGLSSL